MGLDYPTERFLRNGKPFSQTITLSDNSAGVSLGIVKPSDENHVVYITEIAIKVYIGTSAVNEIEIYSPEGIFFDASASNDGGELLSLMTDVLATDTSPSNGTSYYGVHKLSSLTPAYYYKKDARLTAATGGNGAWQVKVGANAKADGTDAIPGHITFKGVQVRKKRGSTSNSNHTG